MPKTLIITLEYPPRIGGISTYVYNLAKNFPPEDVVVYAPKEKGDAEFDKTNAWKTIRNKPYYSFFWPRWLRLYFHIAKIVKQEKIKSIYIHHALPVGYVGYMINKMRRIPYTIFFHGTDLEMGTKTGSKINKLKKVCRRAEKIVVNSNFLKGKFEAKFEGLKKDIRVIYPCPNETFTRPLPPEEIRKTKAHLALEGKSVVITVSRLAEGKGYPHFIRMIPKILERVPNMAWLIVGDGPKKDEVIGLVQKNYLQNVTRFLGSLPYTELPKYYQLSDLFVLLTHPDESTEESWGSVFAEAAASGLPVVAGKAGGVEEVVQNMVTGLVVDINQEAGVVSAVSELLRNKEYARKMGNAGRERVLREFNWAEQIKKLS